MKKYHKQNRNYFICALICVFISSVFAVTLQFLKGDVLDYAIAGETAQTGRYAGLLIAFILCEIFFYFCYKQFSARFVVGCTKSLRRDIFDSIIRRDFVKYKEHQQGEYISKLTNVDSDKICYGRKQSDLSVREQERLLEEILSCVIELARCDAGTLYLLDGDVLRFRISRNNTLKNYSNGEGMPPVLLDRANVCALALLEDRTICVEDVYHSPDYDFSGPRRYDARNGYRTRSMLVVPMRSRGGEKLGVLQLINAMDGDGQVRPFAPDMELLMGIWLHDIGKVTTPLEVMDKARRLSPLQEAQLKSRLTEIWLTRRIDCLEGRSDSGGLEAFHQDIREVEEQIDSINGAEFVTDDQLAWLDGVKQRTYTDQDGRERSWLTDEEYEMLSIRKGTLSRQELEKMHRHVVMTDKMLSRIRFSQELTHVPEWAAAHHEKLNGKGYPRGMKGDEIPFEVRIITILDIFAALVASDRPYKKAKTVEQAIRILRFGVKDGELDPELTEQFIESRCWEGVYGRAAEKEFEVNV